MTPPKRAVDAPNYTQTPNELLDDWLPQIDTLAELKVTLAIVRQTFGWHRASKRLSISRLEALTGLSRQAVVSGTAAALLRGYVTRERDGRAWVYRLSVNDSPSQDAGLAVVNDLDHPGEGGVVHDLDTEKERPPGKKPAAKKTGEDREPNRERLCQLMADLVNERAESQRAAVTDTWRKEMRLLMEKDGRSAEQVEFVIRWVHTDHFEAGVVLGVPKLRERFDSLVVKIKRQNRGGGRAGGNAQQLKQAADEARRLGQ